MRHLRSTPIAPTVMVVGGTFLLLELLVYRSLYYDDAFMSFRYAENLAIHGQLTWNLNEPPTEGFTNLLLVLLLTLPIRLGLDPLLTTRALSLLASLGIVWLLYRFSADRLQLRRDHAVACSGLVLVAPSLGVLISVGMETVIFSLLVVACLTRSDFILAARRERSALIFSCLLFAAYLTRPEAALIWPSLLVGTAIIHRREALRLIRTNFLGLAIFPVVTVMHLLWRFLHFGQILPNPFYLKVGGPGLTSTGFDSVQEFFVANILILLLASSSTLFAGDPPQRPPTECVSLRLIRATSAVFVLAISIFFAQSDPLMNIANRFMFPLWFVLLFLALPSIGSLVERAQQSADRRSLAAVLLAVLLLIGLSGANRENVERYQRSAERLFDRLLPASSDSEPSDSSASTPDPTEIDLKPIPPTGEGLMETERRVALALREFDEIKSVRIAFGDSGMLAYYSRAKWLDTVGLNDTFISRERDLAALTDYYFSQSPDLVVLGAVDGPSWVDFGHGPLGNIQAWSNDARWDRFEYVGTVFTLSYDLYFYVDTSSRFAGSLTRFLDNRVLDGRFIPAPLPLGTYRPISPPIWTPIP